MVPLVVVYHSMTVELGLVLPSYCAVILLSHIDFVGFYFVDLVQSSRDTYILRIIALITIKSLNSYNVKLVREKIIYVTLQ